MPDIFHQFPSQSFHSLAGSCHRGNYWDTQCCLKFININLYSSGFGFIHDGSVDTMFNFLTARVFTFLPGESGNQQRRDIVAFMMCLATDTHAAVGTVGS